MIRLDTGEKTGLYKHIENGTREIVVDAGTETFWIGTDREHYSCSFSSGHPDSRWTTCMCFDKSSLFSNLDSQ